MLTLGSLFDGIGGWLLAAKHAGVTPVWASEIDDFPAAVTARHFPDVKQLGDITKIDALEPVDIICAGSPCQDLSVAGKREGLAGERSGLFRTAIELVHRLRARTGKPRFFVWENVPGAFSSNRGADFRTVLEEIGQTEIPMPERNKWAQSGMVQCDECEIAWRVLDAQYWGVPQRRKRIFLVADFAAANRCASEILFECEGVRGDSAESEGARQGIAENVGTGVDSASGILTPWDAQSNRIQSVNGTAATSCGETAAKNKILPIELEQALKDQSVDTTRPDPSKNQGGIAIFDMTHTNPIQSYNDKKCHTLTSRMGTGGNQVPVLHNMQRKTVRRLTPTECERLQGLPDGYTDVPCNGKPASDSKRYKAIGNGMAQPCADFVIRRIVESGKKGIDNTPPDVI